MVVPRSTVLTALAVLPLTIPLSVERRPGDPGHGTPPLSRFDNGMRYGDVCPDASSAPQCVNLYAHANPPTHTRIFVRAHYEPGIGPLPENRGRRL